MLVTFIFKLPNDNTKYFGKLIANLSDDYDKGLDQEIRNIVFSKVPSVNKNKVKIGILSCERENSEYFSKDERYVFDLLYIEHNDHHELYINFINNENVSCYDYNISNNDEEIDEDNSTEDEDNSTENEDSSIEDTYLKCECCNDICLECKLLDVD